MPSRGIPGTREIALSDGKPAIRGWLESRWFDGWRRGIASVERMASKHSLGQNPMGRF